MPNEPLVAHYAGFHGGHYNELSISLPFWFVVALCQCRPVSRWRPSPELIVAVATVVGYALLTPAVVNGDGLGYARAAFYGARYAGHLGYVPLLALVGRAGGAHRAVDFVVAGRVLSIAGAALAVWLTGRIARSWAPAARYGPPLAATGMAVSFGLYGDGADVEVYAPAVAALLAALYCALQRSRGRSWGWLLAAVAAADGAVLLHMECVLFAGVLLVVLGGRDRLRALGCAALPLAGIYGAIMPPTARVAWLLSASHGLPNPHAALVAPLAALYGMGKALVYSPYPFEAALWIVAVTSGLGLAALLVGVWLARGAQTPRPALALLWLAPFVGVGLAFYASDSERWIFILPLFWLRLASAVDGHGERRRAAQRLVAALLLVNLPLCIYTAHDHTLRDRAAAVPASRGDLVIGPGHGWDEYVGFYEDSGAVTWPLVFYVARDGERAAAELRQMACATVAGGHGVFAVRFVDDDSALGWKELARLGWSRPRANQLLPEGVRRRLAPGIEALTPRCE